MCFRPPIPLAFPLVLRPAVALLERRLRIRVLIAFGVIAAG